MTERSRSWQLGSASFCPSPQALHNVSTASAHPRRVIHTLWRLLWSACFYGVTP